METVQRVNQMGQMMPYPMGGSNTNNTLLWIIIILLVVIIAYLWYTRSRRKLPQLDPIELVEADPIESDKIDVALRLLNDNEKQIVQALVNHGGEMLQKDLTYELGLTRVQTHRAVQNLIDRKIVTTINHFNTKKVTLAEWLIQKP